MKQLGSFFGERKEVEEGEIGFDFDYIAIDESDFEDYDEEEESEDEEDDF